MQLAACALRQTRYQSLYTYAVTVICFGSVRVFLLRHSPQSRTSACAQSLVREQLRFEQLERHDVREETHIRIPTRSASFSLVVCNLAGHKTSLERLTALIVCPADMR